PAPALPAIVDSSAVLGRLDVPGLPPLPLAALVGDQQAAMMGQLRLAPGEVKITYGTSAMLDLNAGAEPLWSTRAAYPLVLWQRGGVPTFCLEGTAVTAGAAITSLRDSLGIIRSAEAGALGAAWLAGLATGVWAGTDDLRACWRRERLFEPSLGPAEREQRFAAWRRHVSAARETPS